MLAATGRAGDREIAPTIMASNARRYGSRSQECRYAASLCAMRIVLPDEAVSKRITIQDVYKCGGSVAPSAILPKAFPYGEGAERSEADEVLVCRALHSDPIKAPGDSTGDLIRRFAPPFRGPAGPFDGGLPARSTGACRPVRRGPAGPFDGGLPARSR